MFGTSGFLILTIAFLVITCTGIFLCKYNLKFVIISVSSVVLFSIFLHFEILTIISIFGNTQTDELAIALKYILPVVFCCVSSIIVFRWGIEINQGKLQLLSFNQADKLPGKSIQTKLLEFRFWFTRKQNIVLCTLALLILAVHLIYIDNPSIYMADERVYISDANRILDGRPMAYLEHPPLAKWIIAGGISIFGNNAVGWRIFPVLFGIISIFIFYFICLNLFRRGSQFKIEFENSGMRKSWGGWFQPAIFIPLIAAFLFATENLSFVQAQLAMLDVFSVTLMLAGFLIYLKKRYIWCGIVIGLSILCKETAAFGLLAIIMHWIIVRRHEIMRELKAVWQNLHLRVALGRTRGDILDMTGLVMATVVTWLVLIPLLEYPQPLSIGDPFLRVYYIYWHSAVYLAGQVQPGVGILSTPWQWLIQPEFQNYNYSHNPHYLTTIGFTVWALIIPSVVYLAFKVVKLWKHSADSFLFPLCWFFAVYVPLIIIELLSQRPMFSFYFYPAVPAICIAIAFLGWDLWWLAQKRAGTGLAFSIMFLAFLIGTITSFVILSPMGTNLIKIGS